MTQNSSNDTQNQQAAPGSESEAEKAKREAGVNVDKSSHDHMSRDKAGKEGGAGGGAKQEQKH
ncbi:hypothetical protein [Massilia sp. H6]|uniref:hypothetical protein n=1 Tax=Massilia sp. H6 TaxID=2970464 RepID=UPI002167A10B|nr:hypothetical protein [Massilia sp. H6]UVW30074.1 hypothetical protein NRS07_08125 [Massilia sp. H6]